MNENNNQYKKKFYNNFFLTNEEKELFFTLKKIHRLNSELGSSNENYSDFVDKMTCYYKKILVDYNRS